jgi:hypothetical protein
MGSSSALRSVERKLERDAQKRRRELMRLEKEKAKLTAVEQARLEVETYENQLQVLLSVHKEPCEEWDWLGLAAALPHPDPRNDFRRELGAQQFSLVASPGSQQASKAAVEHARALDTQSFQEAAALHASETAEMKKLRELAHRVLSGEHMAFIEAFAEFNPVAEFSSVGSLRQFAIEGDDLIECVFKVHAGEAIPPQVKALTAGGKVSCKPMPKSQYHELYQDYVCACVIRMAREVFSMLPVTTLLATALADALDPVTGKQSEQPVLSVAIPRAEVAAIDFDSVSATDAIDRFVHRGNFKVSRNTGTFQPITPLLPADLHQTRIAAMDLRGLRAGIRALRDSIRSNGSPLMAAPDRLAI